MKTKHLLLAVAALCSLAACDTDIEPRTVIDEYTVSPQYYQNLRDYKASDHSLSWGWFADYATSYSPATRFMGLPDSLDICSLWGGIPSSVEGRVDTKYLPEVEQEMRFVQHTKGTKMVAVFFTRIRTTPLYDKYWIGENDPEKAMICFADSMLRPVFENELDGLDLDYEPEGDPLQDEKMDFFCEYLGKFVGPSASPDNTLTFPDGYTIKGDPTKLLCIDYYSQAPYAGTDPYTNLYVNQTYGGGPGGVPFAGCATEKVIYTENVGDNWNKPNCGRLLDYAAYRTPTGRKGGFGAFFIHRDYVNSGWGMNNYANFRHAIQLQNPAIK